MNLKERADLVNTVGSALSRGEHTLTVLPELIRQLLEEEAWKEFETKMGKHVVYSEFEEFVLTPPLSGLGANIRLVRRLVSDDPVTLDLLDQAMQKPPGGDKRSAEARENIIRVIHPNDIEEKQDRSGKLIRRLRKDFPELHEQVLRGEKTETAAAVEAKIYPERIIVNLNKPESAAALLLAKASPEFLDELRRLLSEKQL
jgi:hypothetical protein